MPIREHPYVICHMVPSLDGRIITKHWKLPSTVYAEYERAAHTFKADAWMIGRVSMEPYAGKAVIPTRKVQRIARTDFIVKQGAKGYAIALDPSGKLRWTSSTIEGEPIIVVLTEQVSDSYLAFLQAKGISYLFGGRSEINLKRVLEKLCKKFGVERLLLEGGGKINGAFLAEDLIDEFSVLVAPVADGTVGVPTLFDSNSTAPRARSLKLESVQKRPGDLLWLRYTRAR